ncbi:hypothetical protein GCM10010236_80570 [Streptomyces eurythermus]|nr:hypothetical protein GCM10010236_80570 [Streptomyces eurythermus]
MFTTWLAEYGIPVLVVRGFASQSYAEVMRRRTARHGRATLLWCGDFDASGAEIERDWVRRTEDCWSEVRRVLLAREQTIEYELLSAEGKHGDPRWPAFAARYGFDPWHPVQWEAEALGRTNCSAAPSLPSYGAGARRGGRSVIALYGGLCGLGEVQDDGPWRKRRLRRTARCRAGGTAFNGVTGWRPRATAPAPGRRPVRRTRPRPRCLRIPAPVCRPIRRSAHPPGRRGFRIRPDALRRSIR